MVIGDPELPADLVAATYEAVGDPTRWPDVVGLLTRWAGGSAGGFQVRRTWPELAASQVWVGSDAKYVRAYEDHFFRIDPYAERAARLAEGRSFVSRDVISDAELHHTEFWNDLCRPQGFHDMQGATLLSDDHRWVGFGMFRRGGDVVAPPGRMRAIVPHLGRALRLALALEEHGDLGTAVIGAASSRRLGIVRVDADLHVLSGPGNAVAWLEGGVGPLVVRGRRLVATDQEDLEALKAAVALAIEGGSSSVVVGRRGGDVVSVLVVPAPKTSALRPERSAHVLFSGSLEEARVHALRTAFSLTAAEARVAVRVARGLPLRRIADDLGVSYHTVRAHLRQCFSKTGARRQSALAAVVHEIT
jgi:DNA-binding CsgD family transcriptional regulator